MRSAVGTLLLVLAHGCAHSVGSIDSQLSKVQKDEGHAKSHVGQIDANLRPKSETRAVAFSSALNALTFQGVTDGRACFALLKHVEVANEHDRGDVDRWANGLRHAKVLIRAHDTVGPDTKWTDGLNDAAPIELIETKVVPYARTYGRGLSSETHGTTFTAYMTFRICGAMPEISGQTRYLSVRMNLGTGQELFLWSIAPGAYVADEPDEHDVSAAPQSEPPSQEPKAPETGSGSSCVERLVGGGYEKNQTKVERLCNEYTSEQIAKAIALADDGVTDAFSRLLRQVATNSDAAIECARQAWHAARATGKRTVFVVSKDCRRAS